MTTNNTSATSIKEFQTVVWDYYKAHRREMPWRKPDSRGAYNLYKIMGAILRPL